MMPCATPKSSPGFGPPNCKPVMRGFEVETTKPSWSCVVATLLYYVDMCPTPPRLGTYQTYVNLKKKHINHVFAPFYSYFPMVLIILSCSAPPSTYGSNYIKLLGASAYLCLCVCTTAPHLLAVIAGLTIICRGYGRRLPRPQLTFAALACYICM